MEEQARLVNEHGLTVVLGWLAQICETKSYWHTRPEDSYWKRDANALRQIAAWPRDPHGWLSGDREDRG